MSKVVKLFCCAFAFALVLLLQTSLTQTDLLEMHFLNVGQGDAVLLVFPSKFQILIDGGPDDSILEALRRTMPLGDKHIDWVILSHGDADHVTGLVDVVQEYSIGQVFMPAYKKESKLFDAWLAVLSERNVLVTMLDDTRSMELPNGAKLSFLFPAKQDYNTGLSANNLSLVALLQYGEMDVLLTGDIEAEVEEILVKRYANLDVELLKSPHHGSKSSSTQAFLDLVKPELVIIQSGKENTFGHPHARVLYRYEKLGARIYRNDVEGTLRFVTNGHSICKATPRLEAFPQLLGFRLQSVYNGNCP